MLYRHAAYKNLFQYAVLLVRHTCIQIRTMRGYIEYNHKKIETKPNLKHKFEFVA